LAAPCRRSRWRPDEDRLAGAPGRLLGDLVAHIGEQARVSGDSAKGSA